MSIFHLSFCCSAVFGLVERAALSIFLLYSNKLFDMYVNHHTAIYQDKVHMFDVCARNSERLFISHSLWKEKTNKEYHDFV